MHDRARKDRNTEAGEASVSEFRRSEMYEFDLGIGAGKESICNAGNPGLIPGSGRSSGEGIRYQLQYSSASLVAQTVKNSPAMWKIWV